jgi:glycosyltransferase involved in cell wall biosynthesis
VRVAYVSTDAGVPVFGSKGASVHVQAVAGALARRGADVTLLSARFGGVRPAALDRVAVRRLPAPPKGDPVAREQAALAANMDLVAALLAAGPVDLIYERHALWSHAAMEHARAHGVPGVLEVNAPLVDEQARHRALVDRAGAARAAARAFAAASAIVAVSRPVADWVAERCPDGDRRVHVVPNGADPGRALRVADPAHPPATRPCTIGFVGTLKPWHGVAGLVDAFDRLHARRGDARLLIVGDGPEGPDLRRDVELRGCAERVWFTGAVTPASVPPLLAEMDVAVAPYPAIEPFYFSPLKVLEAMAAGLPVVASDVGDLGELVGDGVTGLLVPPGDASALAAALDRLAADPAERRRMGEAGRARVLAAHTWDHVVDRILAIAAASQVGRKLPEVA